MRDDCHSPRLWMPEESELEVRVEFKPGLNLSPGSHQFRFKRSYFGNRADILALTPRRYTKSRRSPFHLGFREIHLILYAWI